MKEERNTVTISDNGIVEVSNNIRMTIDEIAYLFDIYYQTAKKYIRSIEKSGVAGGDEKMSCTVEGLKIYPDYYDLEMIIAVAFRVQSHNADLFRKWLVRKLIKTEILKMLIMSIQNPILN